MSLSPETEKVLVEGGVSAVREPREGLLLSHPSGASATVFLHGGHVSHWRTAKGAEPLYANPSVVHTEGKAIRNGIPVCFPQFSDVGPLGQHGFARTHKWSPARAGEEGGETFLVMKMTDTPETRKVWPHTFVVEYTIALGEDTLRTEFNVRNLGREAFDFTCALHSYFAVSHIKDARVVGLSGTSYLDSLEGRVVKSHPNEEEFEFDREVDRIYLDVPNELSVTDTCASLPEGERKPSRLTIRKTGTPELVVWNAWDAKAKSIADLPDDGYLRYLCLELAAINNLKRLTLHPACAWSMGQTFHHTYTS